MLHYFITFTPKCFAAFALAAAAVSAELRAILQNKICQILLFLATLLILCMTTQFCTKFCMCRITEFWHPCLNPLARFKGPLCGRGKGRQGWERNNKFLVKALNKPVHLCDEVLCWVYWASVCIYGVYWWIQLRVLLMCVLLRRVCRMDRDVRPKARGRGQELEIEARC